LIYVEGSIRSRQWDDKEGQKRTTVEIVASDFRFVGERRDAAAATAGAGGAGGADADVHAQASPTAAEDMTAPEPSDEDIPF
jgi:single-strand DNA-binding protein